MDILEKFIRKVAYKFPKGYPDINNPEDRALLFELLGFDQLLTEKKLDWKDLSDESRKLPRLTAIADKIVKKEPFKLESGKEEILTFADSSYGELFKNQKADDIKKIGGSRINKFAFFTSSDGNPVSFHDITKTPELGGTGRTKAESSERQERALISIINSVEGSKTLIGENGEKIENIVSAYKVPDPKQAEAYADIGLKLTSGNDYLLSAKGTQTPSIAGGGLKGITQIGGDAAKYIKNFYEDAYKYYKDIFDRTPEVTYNTNLYKTSYFKDINRKIPRELLFTILRGTKSMGGPVDGYYIGPMEVDYDIKGNKIYVDGAIVPIEKFIEKYQDIYAHIKKRSGDYYFTDALQTVNGVTMPLIFTSKPGAKMAKSRFGTNIKPRGSLII